jgi:hypothetical protein
VINVQSHVKSATDRGLWKARGASFLAKVEATKAVWFPPQPASSGKKAGAAAKKTAKKATKRSSGAAKKTTSRARKSA